MATHYIMEDEEYNEGRVDTRTRYETRNVGLFLSIKRINEANQQRNFNII